MKKLLAITGALGMSATSSIAVISCANPNFKCEFDWGFQDDGWDWPQVEHPKDDAQWPDAEFEGVDLTPKGREDYLMIITEEQAMEIYNAKLEEDKIGENTPTFKALTKVITNDELFKMKLGENADKFVIHHRKGQSPKDFGNKDKDEITIHIWNDSNKYLRFNYNFTFKIPTRTKPRTESFWRYNPKIDNADPHKPTFLYDETMFLDLPVFDMSPELTYKTIKGMNNSSVNISSAHVTYEVVERGYYLLPNKGYRYRCVVIDVKAKPNTLVNGSCRLTIYDLKVIKQGEKSTKADVRDHMNTSFLGRYDKETVIHKNPGVNPDHALFFWLSEQYKKLNPQVKFADNAVAFYNLQVDWGRLTGIALVKAQKSSRYYYDSDAYITFNISIK